MKKILFLLFICFIKLNAYEYEVYYNPNLTYDNKFVFLTDSTGTLRVKRFGSYLVDSSLFGILYNIEHHNAYYIDKIKFSEYYKNDLIFLNDLYKTNSTIRNSFFNYLYNENYYSPDNYINYQDYQILYNDEGYAVESIVGGVWKGLYDTPENSGWLYDKQNNILYDNGNVASLFQRFWHALTGNVSKTLKVYYISMLGLNVFILIVAVYLVKVLIGLIIKWITTVINNTKVSVNLGGNLWK